MKFLNILMENKNIFKTEQIVKISWAKIQTEMKEKFGKDIYDSWLRKISFEEEFNNYVLLSVTTRFIRDWITSQIFGSNFKHCKIL